MEVVSSVDSVMAELPFSSSYSPTVEGIASARNTSRLAMTASIWSEVFTFTVKEVR